MLSPDLFRDNRVLGAGGGFEVLHERQPIALIDDKATIGIHIVRQNGHDAMYLRAVRHGDALLVVFDLRDVDHDLNEICQTHPSDVPGLILYTLRQRFKTAPELMASMVTAPKVVLSLSTSTEAAAA